MYICLQRARTAREAIEVFTSLANTYGYASSGESISFADPREVWFMDVIGKAPKIVNGVNVNKGVVWVAVKLPEGTISHMPIRRGSAGSLWTIRRIACMLPM